jgi:hypothetical protein
MFIVFQDMFGSFTFIVNFKTAVFAKMLFAFRAVFTRLLFLALLTNYSEFLADILWFFWIYLVILMFLLKMLFATLSAINNVAAHASEIYFIFLIPIVFLNLLILLVRVLSFTFLSAVLANWIKSLVHLVQI